MRRDTSGFSDNDERWLELDDEVVGYRNPAQNRAPNDQDASAASKRARIQGDEDTRSAKKSSGTNSHGRLRIGLSFSRTIQSREESGPDSVSSLVQPQRDQPPSRDSEDDGAEFDELDLELLREAEEAERAGNINSRREAAVEFAQNNGAPWQELINPAVEEVVRIVREDHAIEPELNLEELPHNFDVKSFLYSYPHQDVACPPFLNQPVKRQHKNIFEILHRQGKRFLALNSQGGRYWGSYPSQQETFFQANIARHAQIFLPPVSKKTVYSGTWVSAVVKDQDDSVYPLHIITKNTLGAVKCLMTYPRRIQNIFSGEDFSTHWPHGLGRECVVVIVDTADQQHHIFRDYEALVNAEGRNALTTVPNLRVYYKGALSELITVADCRQGNLLNMMKPNIIPYAERKQILMNIERQAIKLGRGQVSKAAFKDACLEFFSPAHLSHELALAHFSLTQLRQFYGVLSQSRDRLIELKCAIVSRYKGIQMGDPDLKQFLVGMDKSIQDRTRTIRKLRELDWQYTHYAKRLVRLFELAPNLSIEQIEEQIYHRVQEEIHRRGEEGLNFEAEFTSGKALVARLLTRRVPTPMNNPQLVIDAIVEQLPRGNVQRQVRAF